MKTQSAWRSPWVLTFLMMGLTIIVANIYLIITAAEHAPSLVAENYYERGQDFEKNMLKKRAKDPGWLMQLDAPEKLEFNKPSRFVFTLQSKQGEVVNPDSVFIHAYRPSDANADFSVEMKRMNSGTYQAEFIFPMKGIWDVLASVTQGEDEFSVTYRAFVEDK